MGVFFCARGGVGFVVLLLCQPFRIGILILLIDCICFPFSIYYTQTYKSGSSKDRLHWTLSLSGKFEVESSMTFWGVEDKEFPMEESFWQWSFLGKLHFWGAQLLGITDWQYIILSGIISVCCMCNSSEETIGHLLLIVRWLESCGPMSFTCWEYSGLCPI